MTPASNPATITPALNPTSMKAVFANEFTITTSVSGNGEIACNSPYTYGNNVICSIIADDGFIINSVTIDGAAKSPVPTQHTFDAISTDHTIVATFIGGHARNESTGRLHGKVQDVYDYAANNDIISVKSRTFSEPLNRSPVRTIAINGGYNDSFSQVTGSSYINAISIPAATGAIAVGGFALRD